MPEERKMRMLDYLHRHESITTIMYTNLNTCSRYQAKTDLKKYIFLLSLLFTSISFQAQQAQLSKDAEISLLTVSPSEDEVYTVLFRSRTHGFTGKRPVAKTRCRV